MTTYSEKLKDPRWQKKRLQILERDKWTCQHCKSTDKTLHVHHTIYYKGFAPWDYEDLEYITLCWDCHESHEEAKSSLLSEIGPLRADVLAGLEMVIGMIKFSEMGITGMDHLCVYLAGNYPNCYRAAIEFYGRPDISEVSGGGCCK